MLLDAAGLSIHRTPPVITGVTPVPHRTQEVGSGLVTIPQSSGPYSSFTGPNDLNVGQAQQKSILAGQNSVLSGQNQISSGQIAGFTGQNPSDSSFAGRSDGFSGHSVSGEQASSLPSSQMSVTAERSRLSACPSSETRDSSVRPVRLADQSADVDPDLIRLAGGLAGQNASGGPANHAAPTQGASSSGYQSHENVPRVATDTAPGFTRPNPSYSTQGPSWDPWMYSWSPYGGWHPWQAWQAAQGPHPDAHPPSSAPPPPPPPPLSSAEGATTLPDPEVPVDPLMSSPRDLPAVSPDKRGSLPDRSEAPRVSSDQPPVLSPELPPSSSSVDTAQATPTVFPFRSPLRSGP